MLIDSELVPIVHFPSIALLGVNGVMEMEEIDPSDIVFLHKSMVIHFLFVTPEPIRDFPWEYPATRETPTSASVLKLFPFVTGLGDVDSPAAASGGAH
ncbi:hypothetical protein EVAR_90959_1 [Eumeta japonica]|uniref:Uncharacterized protein n=1 Tax=Eumeta variegata TaxID=151549 RepID=A0A4C1ZEC7_EUMVA|nr:hypothetical protein EVAR_90959_1 [Eumeta japonica]